jgi:hypothetical protein
VSAFPKWRATLSAREAVLFVFETTDAVRDLLAARDAAGLASFVTTAAALTHLAHWRQVDLTAREYSVTWKSS